ncbi:MFS transporter [Propioniciclava sp. MC1595]|uniref:MFS transporter n=1 Tax=unclassified Propioniciclava TaxID=2642922 RepID=UPI0015FF7602|nr:MULTISPECIES: MFS transporter [unclassified Propioniciclava]MBB1493437.1 MFS transporter [Propioniciclava sp. MC1595]MBB1499946.1 MFS transporter [Propioniciclava sp. MC1683]QTE26837.1 MFS transporter [Propioniciclava sp. MC1595]
MFGPLSDAVGRLTLMRATLLVAALVAIGTAVAPSWGLLLALRAVLGFAVAGLPAVAAAYLREEVAPTWASAATGLYIGGTALGGIRRGAEGRRQYRVMVSTSTFAAIRLSRGSAWRSTFMA